MVQDLHVDPVEDAVLGGGVLERGLAQRGVPSAPRATFLALVPPQPTHDPDAQTGSLSDLAQGEEKVGTGRK